MEEVEQKTGGEDKEQELVRNLLENIHCTRELRNEVRVQGECGFREICFLGGRTQSLLFAYGMNQE